MATTDAVPGLIAEAQTTKTAFLRRTFVRDQMVEWPKQSPIMVRADGVHYWDVNGKRYLDGLSGIYVASVDHNNRRVIDAIRRQLDLLHFSPPIYGTNPLAAQLANLLADLAPGDLETVKFGCGGSDATEAAIKMTRQYYRLTGSPGKYKVISRYLSRHGSTLGSLSASGLKRRKTINVPTALGSLHVFPPTCYRCSFGQKYPACGTTCASIAERVIEMEGPATVAVVMVEPIDHTGGVIDAPNEYLSILRASCDRHNALLIFDEIITGIGRTGRMFAAEMFGVVPELFCVAKGLSGGYAPLSALICRAPVAEAFREPVEENPGFVEEHVFEGNPISCAAGIAVLREVLERDLLAKARIQEDRLRVGLLRVAETQSVIGDVRGKRLFQAVEFVRDPATKQPFPDGFDIKVGRRALANGLLCRFDPHWIALGPPLVSTSE